MERFAPCKSEYLRFDPSCSLFIRSVEVAVPERIRMANAVMRYPAMPCTSLFFVISTRINIPPKLFRAGLSEPPLRIDRIKVLKFIEAVGCAVVLGFLHYSVVAINCKPGIRMVFILHSYPDMALGVKSAGIIEEYDFIPKIPVSAIQLLGTVIAHSQRRHRKHGVSTYLLDKFGIIGHVVSIIDADGIA